MHWLDQAFAWGYHQDPLRKAVHKLKYRGDLAQGDALSAHLLEVIWRAGLEMELVIPVPLGRQRERQRGYNQAGLLARPLAAALGLPYRPKAISRVRETASQVGQSLEARRENVADAFFARPEHVSGKRVLLVDDVLTTGATLDAAAKALKQAGAIHVGAVVVSQAV